MIDIHITCPFGRHRQTECDLTSRFNIYTTLLGGNIKHQLGRNILHHRCAIKYNLKCCTGRNIGGFIIIHSAVILNLGNDTSLRSIFNRTFKSNRRFLGGTSTKVRYSIFCRFANDQYILCIVGVGHPQFQRNLHIGMCIQQRRSNINCCREVLDRVTDLFISNIGIITGNDGIGNSIHDFHTICRNHNPAKTSIIARQIAIVCSQRSTSEAGYSQVEITLILAVTAGSCLLKGVGGLEIHDDLQGTVDRIISAGPDHVAFGLQYNRILNRNICYRLFRSTGIDIINTG